jgi:hypothetical protein
MAKTQSKKKSNVGRGALGAPSKSKQPISARLKKQIRLTCGDVLPKSVNRIDDQAFAGVTNFTVTIPGKEVQISSSAFDHRRLHQLAGQHL